MARFTQDASNVSNDWTQYQSMLNASKQRQLSDEDWKAAFELERSVLIGRIDTMQDAVAKLKGVSISFVQGERMDGADVRALDQVIDWLESLAPRAPTGIAALLIDLLAHPSPEPSPPADESRRR